MAAQNGAHVTIIARNIQNLEKARDEIINACKNRDVQKVSYLSMNLADNYESVERALLDVEKSVGPIYMLVNCAGTAICGKIEDTTTENLKWMTNLNFIGTYHCIKAVVPRMKNANDGIIVITSSLGALSGKCYQEYETILFSFNCFMNFYSLFLLFLCYQEYLDYQLIAVQNLRFEDWLKVLQWN